VSSAKRPVPVMNLGSSTLFSGWPMTAVSSFTTAWTEGKIGRACQIRQVKILLKPQASGALIEPKVLRIPCAQVSRGGFIARGKVWNLCEVLGWGTESYPTDEVEVTVAFPPD